MIALIRKLFERSPRATMADYHRMQADCVLWNAEEDRLFDIWWPQNEHRFPKRVMYLTEGHKARGEGYLTPYMEEEHFREFSEYMRANWMASIPYDRGMSK